ncbi:MAG: YbaL family putative K(+) efflux transporter [Rhizomicrobium sp.]
MEHSTSLIALVVVGLGFAFVLGTIAQRLKISPIVGYLLAGVMVGPFTPGFVADSALALQLADIGVVLLMFGVGLHFAPSDLLAVRAVALPGAILQVLASAVLGACLGHVLGWPLPESIVFGLSLSVASTVVMMRALQDRRLIDSERGRIAAGWLVVQDLLTVLVLVLLPPLSGLLRHAGTGIDVGALAASLAITLGKLAAFVVLMLVVGRRVMPAVLHYIADSGSRELFRLAVLAVALGVAFAASRLFGVSIALGAFFGGMILSESPLSQRAAEESLPFRDAFAVLFFVSVGMAFNPWVITQQPGALAMTLAVVLSAAAVAFLIVRAFGYPLRTALLIGAGLAQIGEFSFILADLGVGLGVLPSRGRDLILGTSILSIFANPLLFSGSDWLQRRFAPDAPSSAPAAPSGHVIVVGYGRVGQIVCAGLAQAGIPLVAIDEGSNEVRALSARHIAHVAGNAAKPEILAAANLAAARMLFVAIPGAFEAGQIVQQARRANPALRIVARAHFDAEVEHLTEHGADVVIMGEREIARAMLDEAAIGEPNGKSTTAA